MDHKEKNLYKTIDAGNLLLNTPGNIYWKSKDGIFLGCNNEQAQYLGLKDPSEIIGKTNFDLVDKETAIKLTQAEQQIIETGETQILEELHNSKCFLSKKMPLKDPDGEIIGTFGTSIEITAQKNLENSLKQRTQELTTAFDHLLVNAPGNIYWKNKDGVFLGCNNEQAKYFGFKDPNEIIGKTNFDLVDKETAIKITEADQKVIETGETQVIEEVLYGSQYFLSKKAPLKNARGEIIGIFGTSIDITAQKNLENSLKQRTQELTTALEVKQDFLNNMSHEVRTPLQGVMGMADALEGAWEDTPEDMKKKCIQGLLEARDRLMNLMSNLLDLSNLTKGRINFDFKYHDIKLLIIEVISEFQHITQPIDFCISANVNVHVCCDEWRLKQVIRNVIANSVKHGGKDKLITISLTTDQGEEAKHLKIAIQDEGVGVPEDELEMIFDPFHESKRTKRKSGGTGIGLALCKDIVIAHKGTMWVENNEKVGSTFYITIPYEKQSQQVYTFRMTRCS